MGHNSHRSVVDDSDFSFKKYDLVLFVILDLCLAHILEEELPGESPEERLLRDAVVNLKAVLLQI
jgi:hypothetical protein